MTNLTYMLLALPLLVIAYYEEDIMQEVLQNCHLKNHITAANIHQVPTSCVNNYLLQIFGKDAYYSLDADTLSWLDSLNEKIHMRLKRQAGPGLRVRKEIRALTETERIAFFEAVNALKQDKIASAPFNKYDAIAVLHQNSALAAAHNGSNFPSWHRYYLVLFEEALRTKNSEVTLPYWDSRTDFRMNNPADTVLFTEHLLGNGKGVVYTGPFAYWVTPANMTTLRRGVPGNDSSLIDPQKIQLVLNKTYHREILKPTQTHPESNLEIHHNAVHRWVGGGDGHMAMLETSPMDPVFFLHHCFIDYLWEQFRERQISLGINPENDYPPSDNINHQPHNNMTNLWPIIQNIDGYSNSFTREIYKYAAAPTCQNNCSGASNSYLYCDGEKNGCVSRSRTQFVELNRFKRITTWFGFMNGQTILKESFAPEITDLTDTFPAPPMSQQFEGSIIDERTRTRTQGTNGQTGFKTGLRLLLSVLFFSMLVF